MSSREPVLHPILRDPSHVEQRGDQSDTKPVMPMAKLGRRLLERLQGIRYTTEPVLVDGQPVGERRIRRHSKWGRGTERVEHINSFELRNSFPPQCLTNSKSIHDKWIFCFQHSVYTNEAF